MNAAKVGIVLLAALAIGAAIYQFGAARKATREVAAEREDLTKLKAELQAARQYSADLEKEAAELTVEVNGLRRKSTDVSQVVKPNAREVATAYPLLAQINDRKLANVRVTVVVNGEIYDGFRQLFGLSGAEMERLNAALKNARTQIDSAIPPAHKVNVSDGYIVVAVPAFAAGENLRQQLMNEFRATLGETRYAALESTLGIESIDRAYEGFGSSPRQITISRLPRGMETKMPGSLEFTLTDTRRTPSGSSSSRTVQFSDVGSLPAHYAWLAPVLPPLSELPPPSGPIMLSPPAEKQRRP